MAIAFYEIANAEDKRREALEQTGALGGGALGGAGARMLVGAATGSLTGPAAPAAVTLGVVVGGFVGAYLGEEAMNQVADWIFGPRD